MDYLIILLTNSRINYTIKTRTRKGPLYDRIT